MELVIEHADGHSDVRSEVQFLSGDVDTVELRPGWSESPATLFDQLGYNVDAQVGAAPTLARQEIEQVAEATADIQNALKVRTNSLQGGGEPNRLSALVPAER